MNIMRKIARMKLTHKDKNGAGYYTVLARDPETNTIKNCGVHPESEARAAVKRLRRSWPFTIPTESQQG